MIEGSIIGVIMTSINSVGLMNTNLPVPVEAQKNKKNSILSFKAYDNRDQFVRQPQMMSPQDAALYRAIEEQRNKEKKQKLKQNLITGVSVASGIAIIAMVLMQMKMMKGGGEVMQKAQKIITRDVSKEKTLKELGLKGELAKATDEVKILIDRASELAKKGAHGNSAIMLYGEPGGGKNAWVYGITKYIQEKFPGSELIMMDVLKFNGMYHGQTENNILGFVDNVISRAKSNPDKKLIVFLDEFDSIARKDFSSNAASSEKFQNAFKTSFNKLLEVPNIQIIAATNKASKEASLNSLLDDAILNRFAKKVYVPLPSKEQLKNAFIEHYKSLPQEVVKPELTKADNSTLDKICEYVSQENHHASFRDMNYILDRARILSESKEKGAPISIENLVQAVIDHAESMNWKDINTFKR